MVRKTDALVRDLAVLFVRYDLTAWQPIIDELHSGSSIQKRIAEAIEALAGAGHIKAPRQARKRITNFEPAFWQQIPTNRQGALEDLGVALLAKRVLSKAADLRAAYLLAGGKGILPKDREQAVKVLIAMLAELSDTRFSDTLQNIWRDSQVTEADLKQEYSRWFNIIYKSSRDSNS